MNIGGKCKLLKIYISESSTYHGHNLYHAIVLKLKELGIAGVTVTRGIEGYGQGKRMHSFRLVDISYELPIVVEVVDLPERIEIAIPAIEEMVNEGLILVTDVDVIKYGKKVVDSSDADIR